MRKETLSMCQKKRKNYYQKKKSKEKVKNWRKNKREKKKKKKALYTEKKSNDRINGEEKDKKIKKFSTLAWAILSKILPHIFFRVFTLNWTDTILVGLMRKLSASLLFLPLSPFNQTYQLLILSLIFFAIFSIYPILNPTKHTLKALKLGEISSHLIGGR